MKQIGFVQTGLGDDAEGNLLENSMAPSNFISVMKRPFWNSQSMNGGQYRIAEWISNDFPRSQKTEQKRGGEVKQCNCDMNLKETNSIWKSTSFSLVWKKPDIEKVAIYIGPSTHIKKAVLGPIMPHSKKLNQ